ncbi:MAG: hypothetical protein A3C50_03730 [Candidatus Staskawiczbacteria bacterium RIFCSPHIGHO2_02_FULL_43_16]|uniref:EamA domain-containing protein n=1 Tax=Candidatus Staskawiczbacteria bacterium RIFCSPHIGHO2_01_FULL_41_41 TaxID=1802203 RepID=A0A1G2HSJ8_9BACT|nr:MAG: hypothetical protein A2822_02835 [Candidatus Staskawiczbacteria bacterium RIFCSPHIGHO2_01_FULL_41_41]OGZ68046.1 MAG: hypothetical protein A3C50_03730 [Candidatus Staskawiczbacteria bacterium RIFCSPHIGHO2_02_FULL_43_16]OGZ74782.1 MAG: hypothetical protein A3A12_02915 [Candidatus Staskawiczbacteria bacterium RIFCSPLOWO2_01_FULL_43_17b]
MLLWLVIVIASYLLFGLSSFGDKLVLNRSPNPKLYTFYVGVLSSLAIILIPFAGFHIPDVVSFFWIFLTSLVSVAGLYMLYSAVAKFDVSRVVPIVGAVQPILVLFLGWFFWGVRAITFNNILAFSILLLASIIISFEKKLAPNKQLLTFSLVTALLVALSLVFIKMVFLRQTFLQGTIWIGICNLLLVLTFLFIPGFKKEAFGKQSAPGKKTLLLVLFTQLVGGLAAFSQTFAISLVPVSSLAIINALRGIQYVFIFLVTLFFSSFFPNILKERISRKIVIQKSIAILLIIFGLVILVL